MRRLVDFYTQLMRLSIQEQFQSLGLGPEYIGRYTGRSREINRAAQNFLLAFVLSLTFMYLIWRHSSNRGSTRSCIFNDI